MIMRTNVWMTLVLALVLVSCGGKTNGTREAQELSGAGATFPRPFYNVVFELFSQVNGDAVAYGGIGSGGGADHRLRLAEYVERLFYLRALFRCHGRCPCAVPAGCQLWFQLGTTISLHSIPLFSVTVLSVTFQRIPAVLWS